MIISHATCVILPGSMGPLRIFSCSNVTDEDVNYEGITIGMVTILTPRILCALEQGNQSCCGTLGV